MSDSWTIRELSRLVEMRLAGDDAPANGQVRAVPDERSIRYYTTLGLLDRPALRGRTALYGVRHLAQLVAIKRLQAEGRTLAEIQEVLPTLDDAALAKLSSVELSRGPRARARRDFWRDAEDVAAATATEAETETETETETDTDTDTETETETDTETDTEPPPLAAAPTSSPLAPLLELTLAPGVRLAFHATRPATDADATALLSAASPLLAELVRRHLIPSPRTDDT